MILHDPSSFACFKITILRQRDRETKRFKFNLITTHDESSSNSILFPFGILGISKSELRLRSFFKTQRIRRKKTREKKGARETSLRWSNSHRPMGTSIIKVASLLGGVIAAILQIQQSHFSILIKIISTIGSVVISGGYFYQTKRRKEGTNSRYCFDVGRLAAAPSSQRQAACQTKH